MNRLIGTLGNRYPSFLPRAKSTIGSAAGQGDVNVFDGNSGPHSRNPASASTNFRFGFVE